jgi:hypothetical protein
MAGNRKTPRQWRETERLLDNLFRLPCLMRGKLCSLGAWLPLFFCTEARNEELSSSWSKAMLAALSPEAQVNRILEEVRCVPSSYSKIADRNANSRVIAALKGENDFSPEDGQYYLCLASAGTGEGVLPLR